MFQAIVLHGVTAGHVLPQLLELGRAQACCNTHTHIQSSSVNVLDHIPKHVQVGTGMFQKVCKGCKVSGSIFIVLIKDMFRHMKTSINHISWF